MKLDGPAVQYLLSREFAHVTGEGLFRGTMYDYPMLYDTTIEMGGHVVLVYSRDRPCEDQRMEGTLCVCVGEESARSAREAGAAVVLVGGEVSFQHLYNRMQRIFVENERLDAQLRALVDTLAGFQPLLDACERAMGYPCALIDEQYRLVCASSPEAAASEGIRGVHGGALEPDAIDLFMASREYRYMRASRKAFAVPSSGSMMMKNVFSNGRLAGSLVMEHAGDALSARYVRFLLNYLGSFVEEAYGRIGSFGVASVGAGQVKAALLSAAEGDAGGLARLEAALAESGHGSGCDFVVLRVERSFTNEGAEEREFLIRRLEQAWPYGYCFEHEGELFMLVVEGEGFQGDRRGFLKELPIVARENLAKVGVSRTFGDMGQFDAALVQATIALQRGDEVDPTNWCYRFKDNAFSWLVENASGQALPEQVCHPAVTTLSRYDEGHGTDLLATLATFMRHRYNATSAANALFVARSTLLNRLARIEELTGADFDDVVDRAYLALSLAMVGRL